MIPLDSSQLEVFLKKILGFFYFLNLNLNFEFWLVGNRPKPEPVRTGLTGNRGFRFRSVFLTLVVTPACPCSPIPLARSHSQLTSSEHKRMCVSASAHYAIKPLSYSTILLLSLLVGPGCSEKGKSGSPSEWIRCGQVVMVDRSGVQDGDVHSHSDTAR